MGSETNKNPALQKHIGNMIHLRRSMMGLTQAELAERSGLGHQGISKIENGEIQVSAVNLHNLARALSVPVGYFFETYEGDN